MTMRKPVPEGDDALTLEYTARNEPAPLAKQRHWLLRLGMPCGLIVAIIKTVWWLSASQVVIQPIVTGPQPREPATARVAHVSPRVRIATERRELHDEVDRLINDLQAAFTLAPDEVQQLRQYRLTLTIDLFLQRLDDWLSQWGYRLPDSIHIRIQQTLSRWRRLQQLIAQFAEPVDWIN